MKKLFISDLDGTLFNSCAEITDNTAEVINALTEKGMYFTFATARSVYSAKPLTEKLNINVPCILMNGVSVYDLRSGTYIKNEFISEDASAGVIRAFKRHNVRCFMYKIHGDILTAYFTEMTSDVMQKFAEERKNKFRKPFVQCDEFAIDSDIVYFTTTGDRETLLPVKNDADRIEGVDCAFYEDTYTGRYYLEFFSDKASKSNGIKFLRQQYSFEHITAFGDNFNDLPMFGESDVRVAVGNAKPEVKQAADFTAPTNDCDGVAEWLKYNAGII